MNQISITHAKIIKGKSDVKHLSVSFLRTLSDGKKASCEEEFPNEIHEDLRAAFAELDIHFGIITETIPHVKELTDVQSGPLGNIHVSSFAYGGSDEKQGITLSGHKILRSGKAMNFNAPFISLNEDDENAYEHLDHLKKYLAITKTEIEAYMNGKHAPELVNGALEFPEEKAPTKLTIAEPETDESKLEEKITRRNNRAAADKKAMPKKAIEKKKKK